VSYELSGLRDKLYWRQRPGGMYHCLKKTEGGSHANLFVSLCGNYVRKRSGGQEIRRPPAFMRCGRCDVLEMKRRGWEESGPVTYDPRNEP